MKYTTKIIGVILTNQHSKSTQKTLKEKERKYENHSINCANKLSHASTHSMGRKYIASPSLMRRVTTDEALLQIFYYA
jgi:hypothetical protein